MAMTACKECGQKISKKADKCPHCGAPRRKTSKLTWLVLIVIMLGAYAFINSKLAPSVDAPQAATPQITLDSSPEAQKKRRALMQKLLDNGIFYKIEGSANSLHVYVDSGFYPLKIDDKQSFVEVVFAYYLAENPSTDWMSLHDSKSGNNVGSFTPQLGLRLE